MTQFASFFFEWINTWFDWTKETKYFQHRSHKRSMCLWLEMLDTAVNSGRGTSLRQIKCVLQWVAYSKKLFVLLAKDWTDDSQSLFWAHCKVWMIKTLRIEKCFSIVSMWHLWESLKCWKFMQKLSELLWIQGENLWQKKNESEQNTLSIFRPHQKALNQTITHHFNSKSEQF